MFGQMVLQRRNRIEDRRAGARGQRLNQRRIDRREQFGGVGIDEAFDFVAEESGLKERCENGLLRNQLITDCITN